MLNFCIFLNTKLGTFSENFKPISLPGATPGHRILRGSIRDRVIWVEITMLMDFHCTHQFCEQRLKVIM